VPLLLLLYCCSDVCCMSTEFYISTLLQVCVTLWVLINCVDFDVILLNFCTAFMVKDRFHK